MFAREQSNLFGLDTALCQYGPVSNLPTEFILIMIQMIKDAYQIQNPLF